MIIDQDAGGGHVIRGNDADRHDFARLRDHRFRGGRHHRIEIGGGELIGEIAGVVGAVGVDQGEIGFERRREQPFLAIDLDDLWFFAASVPRPVLVSTPPSP